MAIVWRRAPLRQERFFFSFFLRWCNKNESSEGEDRALGGAS